MASYRFQPAKTGKYFALLCVVVALAIAAPVIVLSVVSQQPKATEPLVITTAETEWKRPIEGVECQWDPENMLVDAYVCSNVTVQVNWVNEPQDSDHSLRRAVRANTLAPLPREPIVHVGHAGVMVLPHYNMVAMNIRNQTPEHDGEEFQILLQGAPDKLAPLAHQIWNSFRPEPLPVDLPKDMKVAA